MIFKLEDLAKSRNALNDLCKTKGLKPVIAYKIAKNKQVIDSELKPYDETLSDIFKKYALKNANGDPVTDDKGNYRFKPKDMPVINKAIEDLNSQEVDIELKKISFYDLDKAGLSPNDICDLELMLTFDEEAEDKEAN